MAVKNKFMAIELTKERRGFSIIRNQNPIPVNFFTYIFVK